MRTHAVAAKDGSSDRGATSWQSRALGWGIGAEQGEFQKTLLGFYDRSVVAVKREMAAAELAAAEAQAHLAGKAFNMI